MGSLSSARISSRRAWLSRRTCPIWQPRSALRRSISEASRPARTAWAASATASSPIEIDPSHAPKPFQIARSSVIILLREPHLTKKYPGAIFSFVIDMMLLLAKYGWKELLFFSIVWIGFGAALWFAHPAAIAAPAVGLLFTLSFFRDPVRRVPTEANLLV